jgi:hypothetical protein
LEKKQGVEKGWAGSERGFERSEGVGSRECGRGVGKRESSGRGLREEWERS